MQKCLILYDDSLKFSRATYGVITLFAYFIHNYWLVLLVSVMMALGTFSLKFNLPYQLYSHISKKDLQKSSMASHESGELSFVSGMTAILLFIGFLFLYFNKFVDLAWTYILMVALLIFLACFVGFCVATLMYVFFKKIFLSHDNAK